MATSADVPDGLPGDVVCPASGEIDLQTAAAFRADVERALASVSSGRLVLKLSEVSFMDSTGLSVIAVACQQIPGRVVVRGASEQVVRLLDVSGMTSFLQIES
jgi:anti-sigma B factor antagonist